VKALRAHAWYCVSRPLKAAAGGTGEEKEHGGMDRSPGGAKVKAPVQAACSSRPEDAGTASLWRGRNSRRQEGAQPTCLGQRGDPPVTSLGKSSTAPGFETERGLGADPPGPC